MSRFSRVAAVMDAGWPDLAEELDRWQETERVATLWWRDDDAVAPDANLDRLLLIAGKVPIALAVIPGLAEPGLAVWLAQRAHSVHGTGVAVLQHGWLHLSHSVTGKKSEFPPDRPPEGVASDLAAGRARLSELFGTTALPILVPPWNRLDACFLPVLRECGIHAISRAGPRRALEAARGLIEVNIQVDLVAWTAGRSFIGEGAALGDLVRHLRARRLGGVCAGEPTGILTHHLIQDEATDGFLRRLIEVTDAHVAARWLDSTEVFSPVIVDPV
jgi:hypothetical protein